MDGAAEVVEESSVPRLLSALYRRGFTGRAEVFETKGKTTVFYRRGRVVKVQRPDLLDRLSEVLVQGQFAAREKVAEAVRLYGDSDDELAGTLLRAGQLSADILKAAYRLQLSRQLARAFFCERPRLEVIASEHRFRGAEAASGGEVDPRIVIYPGIRAAYEDGRLTRELASFAGARVKLLSVAPQFLREAGFREQDDATLKQLSGAGLEVREDWLRARADPRGSAPKAVVLAVHCLDLLDVQRERVPEPRPTEAPRRRTGVTGLNNLDSATVGKMAEAFFKNGDTSRAERAFQMALQSDPQNRRMLAFAAWLEFWKPSTDRPAALPDALKKMKDAVRTDTQFAYGFYFLGSLQKFANDPDAAARSFKAALEADATMHDAQRELRLLSMRKGRGSVKTA
jgi:tetratricopeptide (TPR) repeat protein